MTELLSTHNLFKSFGKHAVLESCSFTIGRGEVFGLAGLNGAGKTTLIRLLLGLLKADRGEISLLGSQPWRHEPGLLRRLGVVLEHEGFWGNLTFEQNMRIFSAAKGVPWKEAAAYIDEFWAQTDIAKSRKAVKFFSRGQRMQCALCRAFVGKPELFLLDEPVVALDVDAYEHFRRLVIAARERGAGFLISSHQLEAIDDLADRVGLLRDRQLSELPPKTGRSGECWVIAAENDPRWQAIIAERSSAAPVWDAGEWRFELAEAETAVPELLRRLVESGCSVRKAAPAANDFSDAIRNEYRSKAAAESAPGKGAA